MIMAVEDNDPALAGLSPEEIAALADDDIGQSADDADALKAVAGDDVDQGDENEGGEDAPDAPDDAADGGSEQDEPETSSEFVPKQTAEFVDGFDKRMSDIKQAKAELREQLNNGEIDLDQYEAKKDEISDEETALRIKQASAENAARQNAHIDAERWKWEQEQFFGDKRNAIYKDKIVMAALNAAVIDLANDPKNANQKGNFFLTEADKIVRERFGAAAGDSNKQNRRPDLSKIPKTLSNLPAADTEQENGGEFAHLEKLSGMDLEYAVAKLTPEQVQRYLTS
jgi:uncharacterized membrane protein